MTKKTLNAENLERLAVLVMDLVAGNAALQRRTRMEISTAQGPREIAADLRKRFVALRQSTSYVNWCKQKAVVRDLSKLLSMIGMGVAPADPDDAFELLWSFLHLAPSIPEGMDDSAGAMRDLMRGAMG